MRTARTRLALGALAGGALLQVAAASPSPDISTYLAPVSSEWVEDTPRPDVIDGPFTAQGYAAFLQDTQAEGTLNRYGFVAGYGRSWREKVTQDYLVERVFEFNSPSGARYTFSWFTTGARTSQYFKRELTALSETTSFGVEQDFAANAKAFRFYFVKGTLFFVVHLQTAGNKDLSDAARSIAQTEYDMAPAYVPSSASTTPFPGTAVSTVGIVVIGLVVLLTAIVFIAVRSKRRAVAAPPIPGAVQLSSDGTSWWDGVRWRNAATDIPPTARRSPDGAWWWDGRAWRRTGT